ncbi:hypothetical protein MNEG_5553 [Monoraphidium neglectum]|uniref:Uncharacterized protein n=1 Tax=Monoraphidium neglectum TaxID=145388 RepID=A0A0D2L5X5_9CHLO|nr:hypothetical protein MNEG_5553 [Monoraphidium neglectum]KIZ02409.1 hypothetical protein MNEG_5553 [Monoraphidium neglectum]|eukprot:XP_013901428.1 hypothetical protein MNEG_5553 [Monoraphidium neglectum]
MAIAGRTSGFAPSDRAPITNFGGMTTFTNADVGFNGGLTTSFDNFGNPVANEGGRGQIFRRRSLLADITATGGTTVVGGANPTIVSDKPIADPAAAMKSAMAQQSQAMTQFGQDMGVAAAQMAQGAGMMAGTASALQAFAFPQAAAGAFQAAAAPQAAGAPRAADAAPQQQLPVMRAPTSAGASRAGAGVLHGAALVVALCFFAYA